MDLYISFIFFGVGGYISPPFQQRGGNLPAPTGPPDLARSYAPFYLRSPQFQFARAIFVAIDSPPSPLGECARIPIYPYRPLAVRRSVLQFPKCADYAPLSPCFPLPDSVVELSAFAFLPTASDPLSFLTLAHFAQFPIDVIPSTVRLMYRPSPCAVFRWGCDMILHFSIICIFCLAPDGLGWDTVLLRRFPQLRGVSIL